MKLTNKELAANLKNFLDRQVAALDGLISAAPEAAKEALKTFKSGLAEQVSAFPSLEQLSDETASGLFGSSLVRLQEYATGLMTQLTGAQTNLATQTTALNGLQEKIDKKELRTAADVTELCKLAKEEGIESTKPELVATRKLILETAKLPVPADNILALPATEFNALHADVVKNIEAAKGKGLALDGKGANLLRGILWNKVEAFNGEMTKIEDLIGTSKTKPDPDPLLGGHGEGRAAKVAAGMC